MIINKVHFVWSGAPFREYEIVVGGRLVRFSVDKLQKGLYGIVLREFQQGKLVAMERYTVYYQYYDAITEILLSNYGVSVNPCDFTFVDVPF